MGDVRLQQVMQPGGGSSFNPITPEGIVGINLSPDGRSIAGRGPEGKRGTWPLESGEFRPIPGLDSGYGIVGWTPDGGSLYVAPIRRGAQAMKSVKVSLVNVQTGKMEPWKTFGEETGEGVSFVSPPILSSDGSAYAYLYGRVLSEAYVVKGLK